MKQRNLFTTLLIPVVTLVLVLNVLIAGGCENPNTPPPAPLNDINVSGIMVPDVDIDLCAFVVQDTVTVPVQIFGWSEVLSQSLQTSKLVLWGEPAFDEFVVGGSIRFSDSDTAKLVYDTVNGKSETWVKTNGNILYFVHGTSSVAKSMEAAISENRFLQYDNADAKTELSLLPDTGSVKLLAAGAVVPSQTLLTLITNNIDSRYRSIVDAVIDQAKIKVMAVGLYSDQDINGAQFTDRIQNGTLWDTQFGCTVLFKSSISGILFSPIIKGILGSAGYTILTEGDVTLYKNTLVLNNEVTVPVYIKVDGNRVYATVAGTDEYAKAILAETVQP